MGHPPTWRGGLEVRFDQSAHQQQHYDPLFAGLCRGHVTHYQCNPTDLQLQPPHMVALFPDFTLAAQRQDWAHWLYTWEASQRWFQQQGRRLLGVFNDIEVHMTGQQTYKVAHWQPLRWLSPQSHHPLLNLLSDE
jgi:hypothetical protein